MERLSRFGVMPVRGESSENILEFEDVFVGRRFGDVGNVRQNLGSNSRQAENPGVICIHFKTADRTEVEVGFRINLGNVGFVFFRDKYEFVLSGSPWAQVGDEGNVVEGKHAMTFLSGDGRDPRGGSTRQRYVKNSTGSGYHLGEVAVPARPDGGLRPNSDYYVTLRFAKTTGDIPQLNIVYVGSDDPEHGGEQLITFAPAPDEQPDFIQIITEEGLENAVPMSFGSLNGVFIPKE